VSTQQPMFVRVVTSAIVALNISQPAGAGNEPVSAFEEAKSREGCASIPYENQRNRCRSLYGEQEKACSQYTQSCKNERSLDPKNFTDRRSAIFRLWL